VENQFCDDTTLKLAQQLMSQASAEAADQLDRLASSYPSDPQLSFLVASMRISVGRLVLAHEAFLRTLELAPHFALARYQYGFFLITSGEVARALEIWGPLDLLPSDHYLRHFVNGMRCLVHDDIKEAALCFAAGINSNQDNEPLNSDIRLLMSSVKDITKIDSHTSDVDNPETVVTDAIGLDTEEDEEVSEATLLLRRLGGASIH
jgi:tetratricopeptide (TPR) repeat protein